MENASPAADTTAAKADEMVPASTEISQEANAKLEAFRKKNVWSRATALRQIVHAWAETQSTPRKK